MSFTLGEVKARGGSPWNYQRVRWVSPSRSRWGFAYRWFDRLPTAFYHYLLIQWKDRCCQIQDYSKRYEAFAAGKCKMAHCSRHVMRSLSWGARATIREISTERDRMGQWSWSLCTASSWPADSSKSLHFCCNWATNISSRYQRFYELDDLEMTPQDPSVGSPAPMNLDAPSKTVPRTPKVVEPLPMEKRKWNTKNLGLRLASDAVSGFAAASMVAPLITIIDKSV